MKHLLHFNSISDIDQNKYYTAPGTICIGTEEDCYTLSTDFEDDAQYQIKVNGNDVYFRLSGASDSIITYSTNDGNDISINTSLWGSNYLTRTYNSEENIGKIYFKNTITEIPDYAFSGTNLYTIELPNTISTIGSCAFGQSGLVSIVIPDLGATGMTIIRMGAFEDCELLETVVLPKSIYQIEGYAFYSCHSLKSFTIPEPYERVTIMGYAFSNCSSLKEFSFYGNKTVWADTCFFSFCNELEKFIDKDNAVVSDDNRLLLRYDSDGSYSTFAFAPKNISYYTIPANINSIGSGTFVSCEELEELTLDSIEIIKPYAIDCQQLYYVYDESGSLQVIQHNAFRLYSLSDFTIHGNVSYIGDDAFIDCTNLSELYVYAETPPTLGHTAFPAYVRIYVPEDYFTDYITDPNWGQYEIEIME